MKVVAEKKRLRKPKSAVTRPRFNFLAVGWIGNNRLDGITKTGCAERCDTERLILLAETLNDTYGRGK